MGKDADDPFLAEARIGLLGSSNESEPAQAGWRQPRGPLISARSAKRTQDRFDELLGPREILYADELDCMPVERRFEVEERLLVAPEQKQGLAEQKACPSAMVKRHLQGVGPSLKQTGFAASRQPCLTRPSQGNVVGGMCDGSETTQVINIGGKVGCGEIQHAEKLGWRRKRGLGLLEIP